MMRIALKGHGGDAVALIDGVEYKTDWVDANLHEVDVSQGNLSGMTGHDLPLGLRLHINRCEVENEGHPLFDTWLLSRNQHRLIIEAWADGSPLIDRKILFEWNPAYLVHKTYEYLSHNHAGDEVQVQLESTIDEPFLTIKQSRGLDSSLSAAFRSSARWISRLMARVEATLSGKIWSFSYETDEQLFTTELLIPLFEKMGFYNVRYGHGRHEYGKDITFSELSPLGALRHYAVQVKAGDIRGGVNSEIDEIIAQLEDAFSMPYYDIGADAPCYISTFIIAISGRFTENAKDKIAKKIRRGLYGSVWFLDREMILELLQRWWWGKVTRLSRARRQMNKA